MATVLRKASRLKPDIRLMQEVSEFEASLSSAQKASFKKERSAACTKPPTTADVMQFTARIDDEARQKRLSSRCFGPRLTNLLQAVQQFAALGDVVVGRSQNIVAYLNDTNALFKICIGFSSYLEKLSLLFMAAGRQAPRHQAMALIYPKSKALRNHLCEYFIVVTQICNHVRSFTQQSMLSQLAASLNDSDLKGFQSDLDLWSTSIREEANLLLNQHLKTEAELSADARLTTARWTASTAQRFDVGKKMKWLEYCSTYDFQTTWKQMQKLGLTSLLHNSDDYQQWKRHDSSASILFSGRIGAGKSVTMANVVSDLSRDNEATVIYFFCRYDIPESLKHRTILGSLARQYLNYFPANSDVFDNETQSPQLGIEDFVRILETDSRRNGQRYIIMDGLDDCGAGERQIVLQQLLETQQPSSRWHLAISAQLSADDFVRINLKPTWNVPLPTENPDIEFFIDVEIETRVENGVLVVGDPRLIQDIKEALLRGANGMFLWVALQLDAICLEISDYDIRETIKSLPRDLTATYTRILQKSTAQDRENYHSRIFKFLAAAYEPLTSAQICEMASVAIGDGTYDPSRQINNINKVLGFCGSLIVVDEEEKTVRFVHHSAKSFCQVSIDKTSVWQFTKEEAHNELGGTILTYLNYTIFETKVSTNVVPVFDAGKISTEIMRQTFHNSWSPVRLAGSFVKPKSALTRDIGHVLAHNINQPSTTTIDHPFLPYAKAYCLLHTRCAIMPSAQHMWHSVVSELDLSSLPPLPCVAAAWDQTTVPQELSESAALFWSIRNSHVPMFNYVTNIGHDKLSLRSQSLRLLALLRILKALSAVSIISRFYTTSLGPEIESHMATRLLSFSIPLKTFKVSAWLADHIQSTPHGSENSKDDEYVDMPEDYGHNRSIAKDVINMIIDSNSIGGEIRYQIFRRACVMGNIEVARMTRLTADHQGKPNRPYQGDEMNLALETISKERFELAAWLLANGAPPHGSDCSGFPVLHRAVLLRNWHLAASLVAHGASIWGLPPFCAEKEIFHACVQSLDLAGIVFLAGAGYRDAMHMVSSGPEFARLAKIQGTVPWDIKDFDQFRLHLTRNMMAEGIVEDSDLFQLHLIKSLMIQAFEGEFSQGNKTVCMEDDRS
ncbi:hypothetical protein CFIO01_08039 [Colletotrichum fioriniae PJ7]|uniref:Nephrocystin 3-like N-terminal domain-containing protein n=1 Tax=Colletotrichum fioriniae PJ7 TaxID=1445577 RepID=A0A010SE16_9PEZI|nr:hypothetical protein CFIO01_08039 [Colletotrichum fioriniae PJ7]